MLSEERIFEIADSDECNPDSGGWGPKFSVLAFARAIEAELLSGAGEDGWRPIETAPKDGSLIDLWATPNKKLQELGFIPCRMPNCAWVTHFAGAGWANCSEGYEPTRWMPPPAAPASSGMNDDTKGVVQGAGRG